MHCPGCGGETRTSELGPYGHIVGCGQLVPTPQAGHGHVANVARASPWGLDWLTPLLQEAAKALNTSARARLQKNQKLEWTDVAQALHDAWPIVYPKGIRPQVP